MIQKLSLKIALARSLRKSMTEPERLLWARLKSRANGRVFKRQFAALAIETCRVRAAEVCRDADAVADDIWLRANELMQAAKQDTPPPVRLLCPCVVASQGTSRTHTQLISRHRN